MNFSFVSPYTPIRIFLIEFISATFMIVSIASFIVRFWIVYPSFSFNIYLIGIYHRTWIILNIFSKKFEMIFMFLITFPFIFSLLFAYFFIAQRERIHRIGRKLIPEKTLGELRMVWDNMKYAVGGYFRAQFKIMGVVGVILAVGLLLMRIEYALLLAAVIALLDFLPMLGTGTVLLPWALFCALSDSIPRAAGLLVLYVITQATRQFIQPKMVGDSIGIDTLTTLFLLFVGYRIYGILGMIIAVPAGLILIEFYEAGAFEHIICNVRELHESIKSWQEDDNQ